MIGERESRRAELLRLLLERAHEGAASKLAVAEDVEHEEAREAVALANACLAVECDWRRRRWQALERLLALVPPHGGELRDVVHLPGATGLRALAAAHVLGWLDVAPPGHD